MKKASTQPVLFSQMNRDFRDAYDFVNEFMVELYLMPKKFVEEAEPAMERYLKEYAIPGVPRKNVSTFPDVVDFVDQLDDLTLETLLLFSEHREHFEKSTAYLKKVTGSTTSRTVTVTKAKPVNEAAAQKQLERELQTLNLGLIDIKQKADEMLGRMEKLELRWGRLKRKMEK